MIRAIVLSLLLVAPSYAAQSVPKPFTKVATVEGITEYTMPNGLEVLLFPDPSKQTVTVNVTYFVGSRHEGYGETGMAHLLEHLLFKGTKKTPNVPQALVDHGARPNGTTWLDRTNYFETLPATDENLRWALELEADRMVNSFVAKKDLDTEMTVVRNEWEAGENNPTRVLMQRVFATAYLWHNYGKATIGARSDIENVPIERLQAFYRHYYQPDNAMLVVAGKFDEQKALKWIADSFGKIPRPKRKLIPTYTEEPVQDGERTVMVRRVGGVPIVMAGYHVPAGPHPDFPAVDVLTTVLGDSPSGRLYKALVETKKAASVAAWSHPTRDAGMLLAWATLKAEDPVGPAQEALLATIEQAAQKPFSAEEVERAKANILKEIELTLNNSEEVGRELSEWAAQGDWRLLFLFRDRVEKVTPADVQRAGAAYLKPSNRTLGVYVPEEKPDRSEVPPPPEVAAQVKDYKGREGLAMGEAFEPSPENIDARTHRAEVKPGIQLALLSKKTRGSTVNGYLTLRLGNEKALENRNLDGELAARMLMRGTKKRTRQQLEDALDQLRARMNVSGSGTEVNVSFEARRPQLLQVLELVAEVLREPAFDAKEFESLRAEMLASLQSQKDQPTSLAQVEFRRRIDPWPQSHPYYTRTFDESIALTKAAKLETVKDFHAKFYGASAAQMAVVGDFDAAEVEKKVADLFAGFHSPTPFQRIPRPLRPAAVEAVSIETPDKTNAMFLAGVSFGMRDDHPDAPGVDMANFLLGGGFLNSRIATRLRQKDGVSYGAGSFLNLSSLDELATWGAYAIYAPENVEKVERGLEEELDKARTAGFTDDEVKKARQAMLKLREQQRAHDEELAPKLVNQLFLGRTMKFEADYEKKLSALTTKQVNEAWARWVDGAKLVVIKAGDFAKAKKGKDGAAKNAP